MRSFLLDVLNREPYIFGFLISMPMIGLTLACIRLYEYVRYTRHGHCKRCDWVGYDHTCDRVARAHPTGAVEASRRRKDAVRQ